jgi:hypothetical protein
MHEHGKLLDLIGEIHDAALEPALWSRVVANIRDLVEGQACALLLKSDVSKQGRVLYHVGADPHYVRIYAETYAAFDPMAKLPPIGQISSIPDLMPYDEYRRGPFIQEYFKLQGWIDAAHVVLENDGVAPAVVLGVIPGKRRGMVDEELRRQLALIAPHARRALLISKAADNPLEVPGFGDTLHDVTGAMVLVDAEGRIVHASVAAQDMLYASDFLRSVCGRLTARDVHANQSLRHAFAAAVAGDARIGAKAIAVPLIAHDGERYVAHVLPLASGERRKIGIEFTAVAAVFVRRAAVSTKVPLPTPD